MNKDQILLAEVYSKVLNEIYQDEEYQDETPIRSVEEIKSYLEEELVRIKNSLDKNDVHTAWLDMKEAVETLENDISNTPSEKFSGDEDVVDKLDVKLPHSDRFSVKFPEESEN